MQMDVSAAFDSCHLQHFGMFDVKTSERYIFNKNQ